MCENALGVAASDHWGTTHGDFCTTPRPKQIVTTTSVSRRGVHHPRPASARRPIGPPTRSVAALANGSARVGATTSSLVRVVCANGTEPSCLMVTGCYDRTGGVEPG